MDTDKKIEVRKTGGGCFNQRYNIKYLEFV